MLKSWKCSFRQGRIIDLWSDLWKIIKSIQMSLNVMHHDAHVQTLAWHGPADGLIKLCRLLPFNSRRHLKHLRCQDSDVDGRFEINPANQLRKVPKDSDIGKAGKRAGKPDRPRRSNLIIRNSFYHVVLISGVAGTGHAKSQKPTLSFRKESCWECCSDLSNCRCLAQLFIFDNGHICHI